MTYVYCHALGTCDCFQAFHSHPSHVTDPQKSAISVSLSEFPSQRIKKKHLGRIIIYILKNN